MDVLRLREHSPSAELTRRAGLAAIFVLAALSSACSGGSAKGAQPQGPPGIPVKVETAKLISVNDTTEYVATLKSRDTAVIMPQVEGVITDIFVHSGSRVSAGTPLMQIDPAKQQATLKTQEDTVKAKQAELIWDQQEYDRNSGLYDAKVVSKQALDQSKNGAGPGQSPVAGPAGAGPPGNRATALLPRDRSQRRNRRRHSGARRRPRNHHHALTTVDKPGSLEAYVYVPIERSSQLKPNLPVQIVDQSGTVIAESRINFISPQVDSTTQTVLAKAPIANSNDKLRNAQFIHARIVWGSQNRTVVPVLAVSRLGGQYFAFVAEQQDGKTVAHQKPLTVGDMTGNNYVVLEGIKPGDKIIVSGTQFLIDGAPVMMPQG